MSLASHPPDAPAVGRGPAAQKTAPEIRFKLSWCKGCGLCVEYCNRGVLRMDGSVPTVVAAERCSRCLQCEAICPDFAIEIEEAPAQSGSAGNPAPETKGVA